jgi:hypothetical protein
MIAHCRELSTGRPWYRPGRCRSRWRCGSRRGSGREQGQSHDKEALSSCQRCTSSGVYLKLGAKLASVVARHAFFAPKQPPTALAEASLAASCPSPFTRRDAFYNDIPRSRARSVPHAYTCTPTAGRRSNDARTNDKRAPSSRYKDCRMLPKERRAISLQDQKSHVLNARDVGLW